MALFNINNLEYFFLIFFLIKFLSKLQQQMSRMFSGYVNLRERGPLMPINPTTYTFLPKFDATTNIKAMATTRSMPYYPYVVASTFIPPPSSGRSAGGCGGSRSNIASGVALYDRSSIRTFDDPVEKASGSQTGRSCYKKY